MMAATPRSWSTPHAAATSPNARCRVRCGNIAVSLASVAAAMSAAVPRYRSEIIFGLPSTRPISRRYQQVFPPNLFGYKLAMIRSYTMMKTGSTTGTVCHQGKRIKPDHGPTPEDHDPRKLPLAVPPIREACFGQHPVTCQLRSAAPHHPQPPAHPTPTASHGLATALQLSPTGGRQLGRSEQLVADRPGSPPIDQVHQQAAQRLDLPRDLQPPSIHRHKASIHDQPGGHPLGRGMVAAIQQAQPPRDGGCLGDDRRGHRVERLDHPRPRRRPGGHLLGPRGAQHRLVRVGRVQHHLARQRPCRPEHLAHRGPGAANSTTSAAAPSARVPWRPPVPAASASKSVPSKLKVNSTSWPACAQLRPSALATGSEPMTQIRMLAPSRAAPSRQPNPCEDGCLSEVSPISRSRNSCVYCITASHTDEIGPVA